MRIRPYNIGPEHASRLLASIGVAFPLLGATWTLRSDTLDLDYAIHTLVSCTTFWQPYYDSFGPKEV